MVEKYECEHYVKELAKKRERRYAAACAAYMQIRLHGIKSYQNEKEILDILSHYQTLLSKVDDLEESKRLLESELNATESSKNFIIATFYIISLFALFMMMAVYVNRGT